MLKKFRTLYTDKLYVKVITVILVVLTAMGVMLPMVLLASLLGVDLKKNGGINLNVDSANIFLFFLFVTCSSSIIWLAQKYIHQKSFLDLGFKTKIFKFLLIGFLVGVLKSAAGFGLMIYNAEFVEYIETIPPDVSFWSYLLYYIYFIFGFLICNSFVEELVTRAYPIEKLSKHINPHIIFIAMGAIFTIGHFITREFDFGYCLSLFVFSYTFSLLYYYSRSIWLVIGMHTGINWVGFSFFGSNWKLGALVHIQMSNVPEWIVSYSQAFFGLIVLLIVVLMNKKGYFKTINHIE
ncbi:MAG: CPBP family intramembrane metalloprotease [Crocinitomicaceae bacterium]|nr:CPBP family intramembrane metalloprotease [Crocinitomicaceae bacterium]